MNSEPSWLVFDISLLIIFVRNSISHYPIVVITFHVLDMFSDSVCVLLQIKHQIEEDITEEKRIMKFYVFISNVDDKIFLQSSLVRRLRTRAQTTKSQILRNVIF